MRSVNSLKNSNIRTLGDLVRQTEDQILKVKNFGKKSLQEIADLLEREGLNFGMRFEENGEGVRVLRLGHAAEPRRRRGARRRARSRPMRHQKAGRQLRRTAEQKLALMREPGDRRSSSTARSRPPRPRPRSCGRSSRS